MNDTQTNRKVFLKRAGLSFASVFALVSGTRSGAEVSARKVSTKGLKVRTAKHSVERKDVL